jgi:hypothetical protein
VKNRRYAVTGLAVLTAASLALAACTSGSKAADSPSPSASPTVDPTLALANAAVTLVDKGFDFKETLGDSTNGFTGTGTVNPTQQATALSGTGGADGVSLQIGVTEVGTSLYVKVDAGALNSTLGLPNTWMTVDPMKITNPSIPFDVKGLDLLDLKTLFTTATALKWTDPNTITGTIDLTKATGALVPQGVSKYAAQAAATPFTATFDSTGQFASISVDTTAYDKTDNVSVTFSNVGTPSPVTAPSGPTTPAPDGAYQLLNQS